MTWDALASKTSEKPGNDRAFDRRVLLGVSGLALMAGLAASSGAQAQCTDSAVSQYFPFGNGGGINALNSVINTVNTAFLTNTSAFVSAPGDVAPNQEGGGVWVRGVAGSVETKATGAFNGSFTNVPAGTTWTGSANCGTKVDQDFRGFQAGHDIAVLNDTHFGANWHFGVTAGYLESKFRDSSPDGSLKGDFQIPFAGLYTAFTRGNLYADAQARVDFLQGQLNDPVANGIFNQRLDARGYSFTGNLGYRFGLASNWFVEPSVGGVLSRVTVDPFDVSGTYILPVGVSPNVTLPGRVQIGDIDSELGRASVRIGTSFASPDGLIAAQPFFTASVFHEFAGDARASVSNSIDPDWGARFPTSGTFTTGRVGTYAQFGVGSSFQLQNTGWLGYGRVDYRTGDNIDGLSFNAGLRYQFTPAAGLESLKDAPGGLKDGPPVWPVYRWTGLYLGDSIGAVRGEEHWRYPSGSVTEPDFAGYLYSSALGYNYQMGRFVTGIEADFGASDGRGAKSCPNQAYYSCESDLNHLATITGRLGYAWGRALIYAKGGWAAGEVEARAHLNTGTTVTRFDTYAAPVTTRNWETGWTVGGGMEFALTDKWSGKAEYLHYELGAETFHTTVSDRSRPEIATQGDIVRVGVNYHLSTLRDSAK
jgi:outer membrane autotransporter protein